MANFDISEAGYQAIKNVDDLRAGIMEAVATVAGGTPSGTAAKPSTVTAGTNSINFHAETTRLAGLGSLTGGIDITTGAGALVLDDVLQAMSTVEQSAAQLVSAENKAQQQVNSLARQ